MSGKVSGIPIKVSLEGNEIDFGTLRYTSQGIEISLDEKVYTSEDKGIILYFQYEISTNISGISERKNLEKEVPIEISTLYKSVETFHLGPVLTSLEMYPPASGSWIDRIKIDGRETIVLINPLYKNPRYWLTIYDPTTGYVFESRIIKEYEKNFILMKTDWESHQDYSSLSQKQVDLDGILDQPPPSWAELAKIGGKMNISSDRKAKTMREAVNQFIPEDYPFEIKQQLRIFYAWITRGKIPEEDPVTFISKFGNKMVLRRLIFGHIQFILDGIRTPRYAEIIDMANKGQIRFPKRSLTDRRLNEPWYLAVEILMEKFPNWTDEIIKICSKMMKDERLILQSPISSTAAMKSNEMWKKRLAIFEYGIHLSPFYRTAAYGLQRAIYIGAAHRWPHKHLEMIIKFGELYGIPQFMQLMNMPVSAIEKLKRTDQKIVEIGWEKYLVNFDSYDAKLHSWTTDVSKITKCLKQDYTIRRLNNQFESWKGKKSVELTKKEAKTLDFASQYLYLTVNEMQEIWDYAGVERKWVHDVFKKLKEVDAIDYYYRPRFYYIPSIISIAQGPKGRILSYARGLLKYTPSTTVYISKDYEKLYAFSRIAPTATQDMMEILPAKALEQGVNLRIEKISNYRSYKNNLHQRLLMPDGTWDDDLSGLLSQISLKDNI